MTPERELRERLLQPTFQWQVAEKWWNDAAGPTRPFALQPEHSQQLYLDRVREVLGIAMLLAAAPAPTPAPPPFQQGIDVCISALHRAIKERGTENAAGFFNEYLQEELKPYAAPTEPVVPEREPHEANYREQATEILSRLVQYKRSKYEPLFEQDRDYLARALAAAPRAAGGQREAIEKAFKPIEDELVNLVRLLSCSDHARQSVWNRVEGEIKQFWHELA